MAARPDRAAGAYAVPAQRAPDFSRGQAIPRPRRRHRRISGRTQRARDPHRAVRRRGRVLAAVRSADRPHPAEDPRFTVIPAATTSRPGSRCWRQSRRSPSSTSALKELVGMGKLVEAQRLEQRTRFDLEMLSEVGHCKGIENYSRYLAGIGPGEAPQHADRLPAQKCADVPRREPCQMIGQLGGMYNGDRARKTTLVEYGFPPASALDNRPLSRSSRPGCARRIFVSATPADYEKQHAGQVVEQVVRPTGLVDPEVEVRPATHQVDDVLGEIRLRRARGAGADHGAHQAHGRAADRLPGRERRQGALPAQRHRHGRAGRDPARPAPGRSTCWSASTCCARVSTSPRCRWSRSLTPTRKVSALRSERSLIQTIGRAARNLNGQAILYADRITDSMRRAIDETERRRAVKQTGRLQPGQRHQSRAAWSSASRTWIDGVYSEKAGEEAKKPELAQAHQAEIAEMGEKDPRARSSA